MRADECHRKAKLHIFSVTQQSSSVEFGITGYYNPCRLRYAVSQYTDLYCHMSMSTFCCTMWSQSTNVTDGRTDVMLIICRAKNPPATGRESPVCFASPCYHFKSV